MLGYQRTLYIGMLQAKYASAAMSEAKWGNPASLCFAATSVPPLPVDNVFFSLAVIISHNKQSKIRNPKSKMLLPSSYRPILGGDFCRFRCFLLVDTLPVGGEAVDFEDFNIADEPTAVRLSFEVGLHFEKYVGFIHLAYVAVLIEQYADGKNYSCAGGGLFV